MANTIVKILEKGGAKYRLLDYLQSTGTQYFSLGTFSFNATTDVIETKFKYDAISTGASAYWLYSSQDSSAQYIHDFYTQNNSFYTRVGLRAASYPFSQDTNIHTLKVDYVNGIIYLDNTIKYSGIEKSSLSNMPFRLLARTTSTGDYTKARIYNFTITRSGTKILDLIPVERISDNAIGLLDLISGTLYTNAGTGTFGKSYLKVEHIYKDKLKAKTYEKLEYIENTSTSYINLDIACNQVKNVELDFMGTTWANDQVLFGSYSNSIKGSNYLQISGGATRIYGKGTPYTLYNDLPTLNKKYKLTTPITSTGNAYLYEEGTQKGSVNIPNANQETLNMMLFTLNLNGSASASHYTKMKVYRFKGNGLDDKPLFDLVPVKRLKDNAIGMLDTLSNTFIGNSGTGTFTGQSLSTPEYIEEDVEQVDYIQSSGTQYINTNIKPSPSIDVELDVKCGANQNGGIIGGGVGYQNNEFFIYWETASSNLYYERSNTSVQKAKTSSFITQRHLFKTDGTKLYVDGTLELTTGSNTSTSNYPLYIGALNRSGTIGFIMPMTIYSSKIYSNGSLVQHLIPVKYGTEYCLLDLVENKLYHNAGTGNFTGGTRTEVQKLTQCYIANNTKYYALDYIKTDGNSVIDTGVIVKKNISKLEIDCNITTDANNHQIGCGGSDADVIYFTRGFVYLLSASQGGTAFPIPINQRKKYIADAVNNKIGYEGNLISLTPTANQSIDTFTIGARKNGGVYQLGGADIIYDFKAYENNVLVKHLVPCERFDGVKGMLDLVGGTFITNASSGSLVAGNKREIILVE